MNAGPRWWRRPWVWGVTGVVLVLVVRVVASGYGALDRGLEAIEDGQTEVGALELREAISWYLPGFAPWREEAAEALWELHHEQLGAGDVPGAVGTLTMLRGGFMGSRSWFGVDESWKERVDTALAYLMVKWEQTAAAADGRAAPPVGPERLKYFEEILAKDPLPSRGWGLLAVAGFAVWVASMFMATGRTGRARYIRLGVAAAGFAGFLAGVGLA